MIAAGRYRFPEVFDCIVKVGSNNDCYYEDDVFPQNKYVPIPRVGFCSHNLLHRLLVQCFVWNNFCCCLMFVELQIWYGRGIKPDRQWRSSSFQESKKVRVSRDLWPWPWPWAHPGCTLTWWPSCASLVAIGPFACEKKRFAQKFTDRRLTPRHCISSFLE